MGLSTQVPRQWTYISNGRNKTYQVGQNVIAFKKVKPGEIANMSLKNATIIQAIKTLGKDGVSPKDIQTISKRLSPQEKTALMEDATAVAAWIYEIIREISVGKDE